MYPSDFLPDQINRYHLKFVMALIPFAHVHLFCMSRTIIIEAGGKMTSGPGKRAH